MKDVKPGDLLRTNRSIHGGPKGWPAGTVVLLLKELTSPQFNDGRWFRVLVDGVVGVWWAGCFNTIDHQAIETR